MGVTFDKLLSEPLLHKHKVADIEDIASTYLKLDGSNANTTIDIQGENLVNVGNLGVGTASPTSSFSIYKPSTQPTADMGYGGLTMPNFSTIFPSLGTGIFKYETYVSGAYGGVAINGFTDSDTGATAFLFSGYQGSTTPTATNMLFRTAKHNGATSATGLAWAEKAFQFRNWTSNLITVLGSGSTGFGTETPTAQLQVNTLSASRIAQIVRGATSQTANLLELQNSSGTVGSAFTSDTSKLLLGTGTNNTTSSRLFVTETSTAPTEISQIYAQRLMTNPLTNRGSTNISIQVAQTSASYSRQNIGTISQALIRNTNTQNWTASGIVNQLGLVGLEARVEVRSGASGTLSWLTGLVTDADFNSNSTATVTNYAGFKIFEPVNASSLLGFTNNYGLYVANMSAATNNYAILTNAGNIVFNEGGDASTDFRVESDTEENMLFLDANADTDGALYLGGTTNGIKITKGGELTLLGTATVWDDLRVTPAGFDRAGIADPSLVSYTPTGSSIATFLYEFQKDDIAYFTIQLPHTYKEGSDLMAHVHWTPGLNGNEESGATVGWKIDYTWASINGTFGAMATADLSDACDGTDDKHQMSPMATITGTGKEHSSMLICNIKRTDTGTDDTWAGTTSGNLPMLLEIDFHYEINSLGDTTI